MKKTILPILILIFTIASIADAQSTLNQVTHWYFNFYCGLDFTSGVPVSVTNSAMYTNEGTTSISDLNGSLLFYSNGETVYNANHAIMQNGSGLNGGFSTSQSCIAIPLPGSSSIWILFTCDDDGGFAGAQYSVIDMSLQGGLGEVTDKNIPLASPMEEKLTACIAANGTDYWVLYHGLGNKTFYAYPVTALGVGTPVLTNAGTVTTGVNTFVGCMKFSPDGTKVAAAKYAMHSFEIFNFDKSTGVISYDFTVHLPNTFFSYSPEWSRDGKRLYLGNVDYAPGVIYQLDMTLPDSASILASLTVVGVVNNILGTLQMGPDGKIYINPYSVSYLSAINDPGALGTACNFVNNGCSTFPNTNYLGLPNYITSWFILQNVAFTTPNTTLCEQTCIDFTDQSANSPTSWEWQFPGANPSSSTDQNPSNICYSTPGNYDVTLITTNAAGSDTLIMTDYITVYPPPFVSISQGNDTLYASSSANYQWYQNGSAIAGATDFFYVPVQEDYYSVMISDSNGCAAADTIFFALLPFTNFYSPQPVLCEKFCIEFFDSSANSPTSWLWLFPGGFPSSSTAQNPSQICYQTPGMYDVTLMTTNASGSDTLLLTNYITVYPTPPFPTIIQNGNTLTSSAAASYQWQFNSVDIAGATSQSYTATQTGFYTVIISDSNGCTNSTTLYVEVTGIENSLTDQSIIIYPNPSTGNFIVEFSNTMQSNSISISIMNILGQEIFSSQEGQPSTAFPWKKEINLEHVACGVYLVEIKSGEFIMRGKISINH